ncbi:hypothetical protein ACMBCM_09440, partial [Spiroplasma sp. K1]
ALSWGFFEFLFYIYILQRYQSGQKQYIYIYIYIYVIITMISKWLFLARRITTLMFKMHVS